MTREKLRRILFAVTIMGAVSAFVNANPVALTEKKSSQKVAKIRPLTLTEFTERMLRAASDDRLEPGAARFHHLTPLQPIKLYTRLGNRPEGTDYWCDLVLEEAVPKPVPKCLVLIRRQASEHTVTFKSYRFSLDGVLESAHLRTGKTDENRKPIHGSAVDTDLDIKDSAVRKDAANELDFWLSRQAEDLK